MKNIIAKIINETIRKAYKINIPLEDIESIIEIPPSNLGDFAFPCYTLSKKLKRNPHEIAERLKLSVKSNIVEKAAAERGYLNIFLNKDELLKNAFKISKYKPKSKNKIIVIDYSHPNIAKPFTLAHLRSTVIGNSLNKIYTFAGYKVIAENYIGDWGTQFGKLIYAFLEWGDKKKLEKEPIKHLLELYVKFHKEAETNPLLEEEGRKWFAKLEEGDDMIANELFYKFRDLSLREFNKLYNRLGVEFTTFNGESFYKNLWIDVVEMLRSKNLLKKSDEALIVDLKDENLPPCMIIKSDGTTLYATRDIAAAIYRKKQYKFSKCLYVVDARQTLHFKQFFRVLELAGYKWANELVHVPFGLMKFSEGVMSTRKGKVVLLEDVLDKAKEIVLNTINKKNPELKDKEKIAEIIGVNAIIFNDLKHDRIQDVVFDWKESFNFEGETGPYLNYTYARIISLIEKAGGVVEKKEFSLLKEKEEIEIAKHILLFPEIIEKVITYNKQNYLARYLLDLSQLFNTYYQNIKIIQKDKKLQNARISLVKLVGDILERGLLLLGMRVVKKM